MSFDSQSGDDALDRALEYIERARQDGIFINIDVLVKEVNIPRELAEQLLKAESVLEAALGEDPPADTAISPPQLPDDYEVLGELGRGGMGIVYKARQHSLGRDVAVKILRPGDLVLGNSIRRFRAEARSLAKLRHPHIVSIHEVGETGGNVYYTMDLIEGGSLADLLKKHPLTPSFAVRILKQVASAVSYAHSHGIIHRDLKPANILIDSRDHAFVADFGLARDFSNNSGATTDGHVLGTPAYMSPEQALGDITKIGESTDIYALGIILYEMLAGAPPFHRLPVAELIHAVIHQDPPAPGKLNTKIPRELALICMKAIAKEPARRYLTVRAFLEDLERFDAGRPVLAQAPGVAYHARRILRLHWRTIAAALFGALTVILLFTLTRDNREKYGKEELLSLARESEKKGQFAEATTLYELATRSERNPQRLGVLRWQLIRARLSAAHLLARGGQAGAAKQQFAAIRTGIAEDLREADGLLLRGSVVPTYENRPVLLWARAICEFAEGDIPAAEITIKLASAKPFSPGGPVPTDSFISLLREALASPGDPGFELACHWAAYYLSGAAGADAADRIFSLNSKFQDGLIGAIRAMDRHPAERVNDALVSHCTLREPRARNLTILTRALAPRLFEVVEDAGLKITTRALAGLLLQYCTDSAVFPPDGSPESPTWETFLLNIQNSHPELARLAPEAALRQNLNDAVREYAALDPLERLAGWKPRDGKLLINWLRAHVPPSLVAGSTAQAGFSAPLVKWWNEHREQDPRVWMRESLQIDAQAGNAAILQQMHASASQARALYHSLLLINTGSASPAPAWPPGVPEPDHLLQNWSVALGLSQEEGVSHVVRFAEFLSSVDQPLLTLESNLTFRAKYVRTSVITNKNVSMPTWGLVSPFGWSWKQSSGGAVRLEHEIVQSPDGIRSNWYDLVVRQTNRNDPASWSDPRTPIASHRPNEIVILQSGAVGLYDVTNLDYLVLATLEPVEDEPRAWTPDDWKQFIARNLDDACEIVNSSQDPNSIQRGLDRLRECLSIASKIPMTAHLDSVAAAVKCLLTSRPNDALLEGIATRARLLAGDATAISAVRPTPSAGDARLDNYTGLFWLNVAIANVNNPGIQKFAMEQLLSLKSFWIWDQSATESALRRQAIPEDPRLASVVRGMEALAKKQAFRARVGFVFGALWAAGILILIILVLAGCRASGKGSARFRNILSLLIFICGLALSSVYVSFDSSEPFPALKLAGFLAAAIALLQLQGDRQLRLARMGAICFFMMMALNGIAYFSDGRQAPWIAGIAYFIFFITISFIAILALRGFAAGRRSMLISLAWALGNPILQLLFTVAYFGLPTNVLPAISSSFLSDLFRYTGYFSFAGVLGVLVCFGVAVWRWRPPAER